MNAGKMRKRIAATVAAGACATVLASAGPAVARAATAQHAPLTFTVSFDQPGMTAPPAPGTTMTGRGVALGAGGNRIGTVTETCTADGEENSSAFDAACNIYVNFNDGDTLNLAAQSKYDLNQSDYPYAAHLIVQGGSGEYDGASGDATAIAERPGEYKIFVDFR